MVDQARLQLMDRKFGHFSSLHGKMLHLGLGGHQGFAEELELLEIVAGGVLGNQDPKKRTFFGGYREHEQQAKYFPPPGSQVRSQRVLSVNEPLVPFVHLKSEALGLSHNFGYRNC
eukprot:TRINITY_DN11482_c0_g2_i1.p2 TRINITY_DN11482_c0_g2~~TRINITY_DN11482_c0_g2_i1.p2  ORF type:complete len:116 (+),score=2.38 TRINITY_DN11482_c0_g2_i1:202-549(+)